LLRPIGVVRSPLDDRERAPNWPLEAIDGTPVVDIKPVI
jgi:tRNA (Thr-GGU) A37 N-methylase